MRTTSVTLFTRCSSAAGLVLLLAAASPVDAQICAPVQECGDVDSDGAVLTTDALKVLRKAVGHPEALTCECAEYGPTCGNGSIEGSDACHVGDLNHANCVGLGFVGGARACGPGCTLDTSKGYAER